VSKNWLLLVDTSNNLKSFVPALLPNLELTSFIFYKVVIGITSNCLLK